VTIPNLASEFIVLNLTSDVRRPDIKNAFSKFSPNQVDAISGVIEVPLSPEAALAMEKFIKILVKIPIKSGTKKMSLLKFKDVIVDSP